MQNPEETLALLEKAIYEHPFISLVIIGCCWCMTNKFEQKLNKQEKKTNE